MQDKKEAKKIANKKYKETHKEYIKKLNKQWREKNKEYKKEQDRQYYIEHKEEIREYKKQYMRKRKEEDKLFKIKCNVRNVIYYSFLRKAYYKSENTTNILGCDIDFFTNYLLETFKKNYGYEWNGKEKVHIDHIKPLKNATSEQEIIKLCHYSNLQLLKATDNLKKGYKKNYEIEGD